MSEPRKPDVMIEDNGFVSVVVNGTERSLDLFRTNNELAVIHNTHEASATDHADAIRAYMVQKGFPEVSDRSAFAFQDQIFAIMGDIRKKASSAGSASGKPNSPDSTDSQSSD